MLLSFSAYLRSGKVKRVSPDIPEAKGLLNNGREDFEKIKASVKLSEESASLVFKNMYDSVRSVLQAFLSKEGYTPYSHEAIIAFNLEKSNITQGEAIKLDKFRKLRNDISYRAVRATVKEAREMEHLVENIIKRLQNNI